MASVISEATANGAGSSIAVTGPASIQVYGTFDGCRAKVEVSHDDTNWSPIHVMSRPGWFQIPILKDYHLRINLENVGSATEVSADTTDAA